MVNPSQLTAETVSPHSTRRHLNRRRFIAAVGGLALSADAASLLAATPRRSKAATLLGKIKTASFHKKVELLQELYEEVAFHESGFAPRT